MSSRGSVVQNGHITTHEYSFVRNVYDAVVLKGNNGLHSLPDFSHSPNRIYIKENKDGSFRELRVYGQDHYPILEIGYHGEESLTNDRAKKILHFHTYRRNLHRDMVGIISPTYNEIVYNKYKKYLKEYGL